MAHASVSELRAHLGKWIRLVQSPNEYVVIKAHGRDVAALISYDNMKLLWNAQDERRSGPINPQTGRPFGFAWVTKHYHGHYDRARDPESHLHPSREEAPWLGVGFPWPPEDAEAEASEPPPAPEVEAPLAPLPAPEAGVEAPGRRWWRVWRR